ncbi:MAG: MBL fold metallo-hydrolase [Treponema sp.]|nr:MBL fold metallo-hydrolase [Treponema sp.]
MKLVFLGRGAGFNPAEGSTSAYFTDKGEMFLIDSGESVFKAILKKKCLDSVTALNIFITHTHTDHVGSLGTLILYASAVKKLPVNIIVDENMGYLPGLRSLLEIYGLSKKMYRFAGVSAFTGKYSLFNSFRYVKTSHCRELQSCGIIFETDRGVVFYSGDLHDPAPLLKVIKSRGRIDKIYIDSNNDDSPNPHHISIHRLNGLVPPELKPRVYCMHINNRSCMDDAKAYGFKVVSKI